VVDGPVTIDGRVTGDVVSISGPIRIRGRVAGDVTAVSDRAVLGPTARVGGDLLYGDEHPVIARGAVVAGKVSDEGWRDIGAAPWIIGHLALWLAVSISSLALGLLLLWVAPGTADRTVDVFRRRAGHVALAGLIIFIGLPFAAVFAIATLVGLPLGIAILLALVPLGAVGYVTGVNIIGRLVASRARPAVAFLAGWAILRAVALLPAFGPPVAIVMLGLGLGALLLAGWESRGRLQPAGEATGASPPGVPAMS
jgi:hypothetical protein